MSSRRALLLLLLAPGLAAAQAAAQPGAGAATEKRIVTLDEAVRTALAHQPQLRQAQASAHAGGARADQVRAGLLPQLDASGQVQRYGSNATSADGARRGRRRQRHHVERPAQRRTGALRPRQPTAAWRSAGASARLSARHHRARPGSTSISGVRAAYFAARADRDLAKVARETPDQRPGPPPADGGLRGGGHAAEPSPSPSRSRRWPSAQLTLIQADNTYANARAQLAQAMGLTAWEDFEVGDDTMPAVAGRGRLLRSAASPRRCSARPELSSLRAQQDAEPSRPARRPGPASCPGSAPGAPTPRPARRSTAPPRAGPPA